MPLGRFTREGTTWPGFSFTTQPFAMEAKGKDAWKPIGRDRPIMPSLRAYAAMVQSADTGAVRDVSLIER